MTFLVVGHGCIDERAQAHPGCQLFIRAEMDLGRDSQAQFTTDESAKKAGGAIEASLKSLCIAGFIEWKVEDLGVTEVQRHAHTGDGDDADPRIVDLSSQQVAQHALQPGLDATATMRITWHGDQPSSVLATSTLV